MNSEVDFMIFAYISAANAAAAATAATIFEFNGIFYCLHGSKKSQEVSSKNTYPVQSYLALFDGGGAPRAPPCILGLIIKLYTLETIYTF